MFEDIEEEDFDEEFPEEFDEESPERNFIQEFLSTPFNIAIAVLGGLIVIALICGLLYAAFGGGSRQARATEIAEAYEQQTQVAFAAAETARVAAFTATSPPTDVLPPTNTQAPTATRTPVVVMATNTPLSEATQDPRTATVGALLTQAAEATVLPTSTAFATALPETGLVDDIGVPGLLAMAALAVLVIFVVRRLRTATR